MDSSRREPRRRRNPSVGALAVLPVFFDLNGKRVVVAGGSAAAAWKAELLAAAGAQVEVYAAAPSEEISEIADGALASLHLRSWVDDDLLGAAIALADAPEDEEAVRFAAAAKAAGVPYNIIDRPGLCSFQFGSIVERSPIVIGVSTAGAAPALAQAVRTRIEAALPQGLRDWAARAAEWRPKLRALRLGHDLRRRFWSSFAERAFAAASGEAPPASFEPLLVQARAPKDAGTIAGSVALVGAGPGDPELLTMKAVRILQSADVVLFDDLASPETVALARRESQKITVGKRGYKPSCTQEDITELMSRLAREGKRVVRLKGGDPMLFGRANEEIDRLLAEGVPCEVVPGVTSASAAAAALGRSLSERDIARRVQFVTAHAKDGRLPDDLDWSALADPKATTAVYMGVRTLPALVAKLMAAGLPADTPAAIVESASRADQAILRAHLSDLPQRAAQFAPKGPCLILIGQAMRSST